MSTPANHTCLVIERSWVRIPAESSTRSSPQKQHIVAAQVYISPYHNIIIIISPYHISIPANVKLKDIDDNKSIHHFHTIHHPSLPYHHHTLSSHTPSHTIIDHHTIIHQFHTIIPSSHIHHYIPSSHTIIQHFHTIITHTIPYHQFQGISSFGGSWLVGNGE